MEVVASLFEGRTAAAQCGLFAHKSVPVIFEPPCIEITTIQWDGLCQIPFTCSSFAPQNEDESGVEVISNHS